MFDRLRCRCPPLKYDHPRSQEKGKLPEKFSFRDCCRKGKVKNILDENLRDVFRTQSNIYVGAFVQ